MPPSNRLDQGGRRVERRIVYGGPPLQDRLDELRVADSGGVPENGSMSRFVAVDVLEPIQQADHAIHARGIHGSIPELVPVQALRDLPQLETDWIPSCVQDLPRRLVELAGHDEGVRTESVDPEEVDREDGHHPVEEPDAIGLDRDDESRREMEEQGEVRDQDAA